MSKRCVHVVDDEGAIRRSLHLMLQVLGYEAHSFESGVSFLQAQSETRCECVLLDLRMPEMDGLEVQRRLNAAGSDLSVIVMSGHGDLKTAVTAMEQGAIAFLEKPFTRNRLEQVLELAFLRLEDPDGYGAYLKSAAAALDSLDPADQKVLELIARGHDSESIGQQTGLSAVSIEVARSRIYSKLQAETGMQVLRMAFAARRAASHQGIYGASAAAASGNAGMSDNWATRSGHMPQLTESKPSVLLVEDDDAVRRSLQLLLWSRGYDVRAYPSGVGLAREPAAMSCGCIVADLMMPEINAIQLLDGFRAAGWSGKSILISGFLDQASEAKARAAGYDAILPKPVSDSVLVRAIEGLLPKPAG
jgi:two-component system response regulator FixJ